MERKLRTMYIDRVPRFGHCYWCGLRVTPSRAWGNPDLTFCTLACAKDYDDEYARLHPDIFLD